MLKPRAFLLLALCSAFPAQAGLFSDDEARKQIKELDARALRLEAAIEQQTKSMLDLHGQIEMLNTELRKLRGQNEELSRGLQDAEKREKDFYVDLDTRLRRFESIDSAEQPVTAGEAVAPPIDPDNPAQENRAYETAYGLFKGGSYESAAKAFQEFIRKYPASVHTPNATYWLGNALFATKKYDAALEVYRTLRKSYPAYPRDAEVLFNIAGAQQELKQGATAQKTLKLLISKYPDSEAAARAKKLVTSK